MTAEPPRRGTLPSSGRRRHFTAADGPAILAGEPVLTREHAMAQATLKNQQKILAGHRTIISNQNKILKNQVRLGEVVGNQIKIMRNQQAILKNQKKILADIDRRAKGR
jgi:hypothetical protein